MDLGIRGKRALVCASSKGLGLGCARALAQAGVDLVMNARGVDALEAAAAAIRADFGVVVDTVAADVTTENGRMAVLNAASGVDILVTNAGGPPPGLWSDWDRDDFIRALDANMLTPIALMKALESLAGRWSTARRCTCGSSMTRGMHSTTDESTGRRHEYESAQIADLQSLCFWPSFVAVCVLWTAGIVNCRMVQIEPGMHC